MTMTKDKRLTEEGNGEVGNGAMLNCMGAYTARHEGGRPSEAFEPPVLSLPNSPR